METRIARKDIKTISLATDIATVAAYDKQIPESARIDDAPLAQILTGKSALTLQNIVNAFKPMAGNLVVIIGHINTATGAFEFKNDDGETTSTPISKLMEAAKLAEVNLFPAGCESELFAPLGTETKVNSVYVVNQIGEFFRKASDNPIMGLFFLMALGPKFTVSVDITEFELYGRVEVINDQNVHVGDWYWSPATRSSWSQDPPLTPPWLAEDRDGSFYASYARKVSFSVAGVLILIGLAISFGVAAIKQRRDIGNAENSLGSSGILHLVAAYLLYYQMKLSFGMGPEYGPLWLSLPFIIICFGTVVLKNQTLRPSTIFRLAALVIVATGILIMNKMVE